MLSAKMSVLSAPSTFADWLLNGVVPPASRRTLLARAAFAGFAVGLSSRAWMRSVSNEPQFSVPGTVLILLVFSGLGAAAGLALWWQWHGSNRRPLVQRATGFAPLALMGPFIPLFLPGLFLALLQSHRPRRRRIRWPLTTLATLLAAFLLLAFAQRPGSVAPFVAVSGYLVLAAALYVTNRIALAPLAPRHDPMLTEIPRVRFGEPVLL